LFLALLELGHVGPLLFVQNGQLVASLLLELRRPCHFFHLFAVALLLVGQLGNLRLLLLVLDVDCLHAFGIDSEFLLQCLDAFLEVVDLDLHADHHFRVFAFIQVFLSLGVLGIGGGLQFGGLIGEYLFRPAHLDGAKLAAEFAILLFFIIGVVEVEAGGGLAGVGLFLLARRLFLG
jgi:hypothetical protein